MRTPTARDLVNVWGRNADPSPTRLAVDILAAAEAAVRRDELENLPLGVRDLQLLRIREALLGRPLTARARCPSCGESLDVEIDVSELGEGHSISGSKPVASGTVDENGLSLRLRKVTSADLLALEGIPAGRDPGRFLARRCVERAERDGEEIRTDDLSDDELDRLGDALASLDPDAEIRVTLDCPACGHSWSDVLDVAAFFAEELASLVAALLSEVHVLALAYGWSETEILEMGARRRRSYLELLGA